MHMMPDPKRFNVDAELYKRSHPPVRSMVSLNSKRIHINPSLFGNGHSLRPGVESLGPDYPGSCIVNNPTSWSIFNGLLCRLVR